MLIANTVSILIVGKAINWGKYLNTTFFSCFFILFFLDFFVDFCRFFFDF